MELKDNKAKLNERLKDIDNKISSLNDEKIKLLFEFLGLTKRKDVPKDYLLWDTILIVVPDRKTSQELRPFKHSISRIAISTNPNAKQVHLFDLNDWKNAFRNKTQLQIRNLLKTTFGGVNKRNDHEN